MPETQNDLFGQHSDAPELPSEEVVALVRARLRGTLALVKNAQTMPWTDQLAIIREENAFRFGKDLLPPPEGAMLWAAFDAEMDRLYGGLNESMEPGAAS